jgi:hypothetical protein
MQSVALLPPNPNKRKKMMQRAHTSPPQWVQRLSPVLRQITGAQRLRLARLAPAWPRGARGNDSDSAKSALRALAFWGVSMSAAARACPRLALGDLLSCALRIVHGADDRHRPALPPNQRRELRGRQDALDFVVRLDRPELLDRLSAHQLMMGLDVTAEDFGGLEAYLVRRDAARCFARLLKVEVQQQQQQQQRSTSRTRNNTPPTATKGGGAVVSMSPYRIERLMEIAGRHAPLRVLRDIVFRQHAMRRPPPIEEGAGRIADYNSSARTQIIQRGIMSAIAGDDGGDDVDGSRAAVLLFLFRKLQPQHRGFVVSHYLKRAAESGKWTSWYVLHRLVARWAPTTTKQDFAQKRAIEVRNALRDTIAHSRSWRRFLERLEAMLLPSSSSSSSAENTTMVDGASAPAQQLLPWPKDAAVTLARQFGVTKLRWALAHGAAWTEQLEAEVADFRNNAYRARITAETADWIEQERAKRDLAQRKATEQLQRCAAAAALVADKRAAAADKRRVTKKQSSTTALPPPVEYIDLTDE